MTEYTNREVADAPIQQCQSKVFALIKISNNLKLPIMQDDRVYNPSLILRSPPEKKSHLTSAINVSNTAPLMCPHTSSSHQTEYLVTHNLLI